MYIYYVNKRYDDAIKIYIDTDVACYMHTSIKANYVMYLIHVKLLFDGAYIILGEIIKDIFLITIYISIWIIIKNT